VSAAAPGHVFRTRRRVEFADTDMGGILHFSRFFVYMETAEHLLLESLGTSVATLRDGKPVGWPRVAASCDYRKPARFGELLDIEVRVERVGTKSVTWGFSFTRAGELLATGRMTSVCCELGPDGVRSLPIPAELKSRLASGPR
jgi:YbgC/YbaW family acyl-CoA thioester hydrolase